MKQPTAQDEQQENFSNSFMYSIHQMHFLVQKHLEQTLSTNKSISFSQFLILVGCLCQKESGSPGVTQLSIAEKLSITEATVSRHISTLVDLGYLLRSGNKTNRRKHDISLTKEGEKVFKKTKQIINKELDDIFTVIEEKDRKKIMQSFEKILVTLHTKNNA